MGDDLSNVPPPIDAAEVARLDEARQANGVAAVVDVAESIGGGFLCFAEIGSWANQAMGLGMSGPVDDAGLDRLIAFYESRGVEPRIEVCPYAHETLVRGLADRSFVVREFKNVFVRDLRVPLPADIPGGIEVRRVDPANEREVDSFIHLKVQGFEVNSPVFDRLTRRGLLKRKTTGWLALIEGKPVAAGSVEIAPPVAGLFGMTTLPSYRRRGCQRALMIARLRAGVEAGCSIATIHSEPHIGTGRNAARLGFRVVYTKVTLVRPGPGLIPSP